MKTIRNRYPSAWTKYGFVNAFNPLKNWYDSDVIGIDTGIILLMAENLRTRFVWDTFMKTAEAQRGMERAGFHKYDDAWHRLVASSGFSHRTNRKAHFFIKPSLDAFDQYICPKLIRLHLECLRVPRIHGVFGRRG